jgi:hypothetical protein
VILDWRRYGRMTDARRDFGADSCVYVQADAAGRPVRVGMASQGLHARYRGGTGWAIDAAMHNSGNLVFVAGSAIRVGGRRGGSLDLGVQRCVALQQRGQASRSTTGGNRACRRRSRLDVAADCPRNVPVPGLRHDETALKTGGFANRGGPDLNRTPADLHSLRPRAADRGLTLSVPTSRRTSRCSRPDLEPH